MRKMRRLPFDQVGEPRVKLDNVQTTMMTTTVAREVAWNLTMFVNCTNTQCHALVSNNALFTASHLLFSHAQWNELRLASYIHCGTAADEGGSRVGERGQGRGAAGADRGEAPQAPREVVWGGGFAPSPEIFLNFLSRNGAFLCILQQ